MAIIKGDVQYTSSFDVQKRGPLDGKVRVGLKTDLVDEEFAKYSWAGMIVSVTDDTDENKGAYFLKALPSSEEGNWEKVGSSLSEIDEGEFE